MPPTPVTSGSEAGNSAFGVANPLVAPKSPADASTVIPAAWAA